MTVPARYVLEYSGYPPVVLSLVGLAGHGKSVFLASLLSELDKLHEEWPEFYYNALDEDGLVDIRRKRDDLRHGILPRATPQALPHPVIVRLHGIPSVGNRHLLMYDTSGESFSTASRLRQYGGYVSHSHTIVWLLSLPDLESADDALHFIAVYLQAYAEMGGALRQQKLLVVLTKADMLVTSEPTPEVFHESLAIRGWQQSVSARRRSEQMSDEIEQWLTERQGFANVVRNLRGEFASVLFVAVSSLGPQGGTCPERVVPDPRGVLLPLVATLNHDTGALPKPRDTPRSIEISDTVVSIGFPEGRRTAYCLSSSGALRYVNLLTGSLEETWARSAVPVTSASFSADASSVVALNAEGRVVGYRIEPREVTPILAGSPHPSSVAMSLDGRLVALSFGRHVSVFECSTARLVATHEGPTVTEIRAVAFSPEGSHVAIGGNDGRVVAWSLVDNAELLIGEHRPRIGSPPRYFTGPHGGWYEDPVIVEIPVTSLAYLPGGDGIVSGYRDGMVVLLHHETRSAGRLVSGGPAVSVTACSPDGRHVAIGDVTGAVSVFELSQASAVRVKIAHETRHDGCVTAIAFSPDGSTLVSGAMDGAVHVCALP